MALRSLGSSLVAKSSPGSASRDVTESRIGKPVVPGKGLPGSLARQFIEDPLMGAVPAGSAKILSSSPGQEAISQIQTPPMTEDQGLLAGAMGQPGTPQARGQNQPLFQGGLTPTQSAVRSQAAPQTYGGKSAKVVAQTSNLPDVGYVGPEVSGGESIQAAPTYNVTGLKRPSEAAVQQLSGRVSADEPGVKNVEQDPTWGQAIVGGTGHKITQAAQAINNALGTSFQLAPGGLGAQLQAKGGALADTLQGKGSLSKATQDASNVLRSLLSGASNVAGTVRSKASSAVSKLRSLFGR